MTALLIILAILGYAGGYVGTALLKVREIDVIGWRKYQKEQARYERLRNQRSSFAYYLSERPREPRYDSAYWLAAIWPASLVPILTMFLVARRIERADVEQKASALADEREEKRHKELDDLERELGIGGES